MSPVEVLDRLIGIDDCVPHILDRAADVGLVDVERFLHLLLSCLQTSFDAGDRSDPQLGVSADPAILDQPDWHWIEVVELRSTLFVGRHQPRFLEDLQVVHDAIPGHLGEGGCTTRPASGRPARTVCRAGVFGWGR